MQIDVKFKDEDGLTVVEGKLNNAEISYLLQFAVNNLMAAGVVFTTDDEDESVKMKFPVSTENMN